MPDEANYDTWIYRIAMSMIKVRANIRINRNASSLKTLYSNGVPVHQVVQGVLRQQGYRMNNQGMAVKI